LSSILFIYSSGNSEAIEGGTEIETFSQAAADAMAIPKQVNPAEMVSNAQLEKLQQSLKSVKEDLALYRGKSSDVGEAGADGELNATAALEYMRGEPSVIDLHNLTASPEPDTEKIIAAKAAIMNKWTAIYKGEAEEKTTAIKMDSNAISSKYETKERGQKTKEDAEDVQEKKQKKLMSAHLAQEKGDLLKLQEAAELTRVNELGEKTKESKTKVNEGEVKNQFRQAHLDRQREGLAQLAIEKDVKKKHMEGMDERQREIYVKTDEAITKEEKAMEVEQQGEAAFQDIQMNYERSEATSTKQFKTHFSKWQLQYDSDIKGKEGLRDVRNQMCDMRIHTTAMNKVRHSANVNIDIGLISARDRAQSRGMDTMEEMFATWHDRERADKSFHKLGGRNADCPVCEDMYTVGDKKFKGPTPCALQILMRKNQGIPTDGIAADPTLMDCKQEAHVRATHFWQGKERYNKYGIRMSKVRDEWMTASDKEKTEKKAQFQERGIKGREVKEKKLSFAQESKSFFSENLAAVDRLEEFMSGIIPDLRSQKIVADKYHLQLHKEFELFQPRLRAEKSTKAKLKFDQGELDHVEHHAAESLTKMHISQEPHIIREHKSKVQYNLAAERQEIEASKTKEVANKEREKFVVAQSKESSEKESQMQKWSSDVMAFTTTEKRIRSQAPARRQERKGKVKAIADKAQKESSMKARLSSRMFTSDMMEQYVAKTRHLKTELAKTQEACNNDTKTALLVSSQMSVMEKNTVEEAKEAAKLASLGLITAEKAEEQMKAAINRVPEVMKEGELSVEAKDKAEACMTRFKQLDTDLVVTKMNYTAGVESRGCGWQKCSTSSCKPCKSGYFVQAKGKRDPETNVCNCDCSCKSLAGIVKMDDMTWISDLKKKEFMTPDESNKALVTTKAAVCASDFGRQYSGCIGTTPVPSTFPMLAGKVPVPVQCGCNVFFLQGFQFKVDYPKFKSTDENSFGTGFWKPAIELEKYSPQLQEYINVCFLGADVLPRVEETCPANRENADDEEPEHVRKLREIHEEHRFGKMGNNSIDNGAWVGEDLETFSLVELDESNIKSDGAAGEADIDEIENDASMPVSDALFKQNEYKRELQQAEMNNEKRKVIVNQYVARKSNTHADDWVEEGYMDPRKHKEFNDEHTKEALAFKGDEVSSVVWKKALYQKQKCYMKFQHMWSLCGAHKARTGKPITLYCKLEMNGPTVVINNAGCNCPELVRSRFVGTMMTPGALPEPCADYFLKWSAEARDRYMETGPIRACGTQLQRRCNAQEKDTDERRQKLLVTADVHEDEKNVLIHKLIRKYDKGLENAQVQLGSLNAELEAPTFEYAKIPGLKLNGKEVNVENSAECRTICNNAGPCKSYSTSKSQAKCFWSASTIEYSDDWKMYLKQKQNGESGRTFFIVSGLKSEDQPEAIGGNEVKTSLGECKYECFNNEDCGGFSYNAKEGKCLGQGSGMSYDPDFDYFEKDSELDGGTKYKQELMQQRLDVENKEKDVLKEEWVDIVKTKNAALKEAKASVGDSTILGDSNAPPSNSPGWTTMPGMPLMP